MIKFSEKIAYALGDGAANIAWRGVATFLFIFYTDVFGLHPATVGVLMLISRSSDGISDIAMGIIGDRTKSRYGKFRPWILWTAIPLGVILAMLFTAPDLSETGKIVYAYVTYIVFTLVYTANNIPYGALMAVMTGDDKERTSLGSYRMVGAFAGGMIVQGALLFLVSTFGDVNPVYEITEIESDKYTISVTSSEDVADANIKTKDGIAVFEWADSVGMGIEPTSGKSFSMEAHKKYSFVVSGEEDVTVEKVTLINQRKGYSRSMYLMAAFLSIFMFITFYGTKERITPPKSQENNLKQDFRDLVRNKPWVILLVIGLLFSIYNSIKQGIVVIYFSHYIHNQLLAGSYLVVLMIASILGAMVTTHLGRKLGKKMLFIYALLFSGIVNALIIFIGPENIVSLFGLGIISEFTAAIFPTLFFAMLGDAADYSEYKNGRRATGLIYSAGSFATKFGGGIAMAIIGFVLAAYNYDGQDKGAIEGAIPGIKMLMSWIPSIVVFVAAVLMSLYPLSQKHMTEITVELGRRREGE